LEPLSIAAAALLSASVIGAELGATVIAAAAFFFAAIAAALSAAAGSITDLAG
jgi:hypothetical protein